MDGANKCDASHQMVKEERKLSIYVHIHINKNLIEHVHIKVNWRAPVNAALNLKFNEQVCIDVFCQT